MISVILCVYNCEKYIRECIESVLNQTYKKFEFIIIDDGSTDLTSEIIKEYIEDNRIIYIKEMNEGLAKSRKKGINLATGEYIMFIDSDDLYSSYTIEYVMEALKSDCDLVVFNWKNFMVDVNEEKSKLVSEYYDKKMFFQRYIKTNIINGTKAITMWSHVYKRKLLESILVIAEAPLEDYSFNISYYNQVNNAIFINNQLYYYRIVNNSLSKRFHNEIFETLLIVQSQKEEFYDNNMIYLDDCREDMATWFLNYIKNIFYIIYLYEVPNKLNRKKYIRNILNNQKVQDQCAVVQKHFISNMNANECFFYIGLSKLKMKAMLSKIKNYFMEIQNERK